MVMFEASLCEGSPNAISVPGYLDSRLATASDQSTARLVQHFHPLQAILRGLSAELVSSSWHQANLFDHANVHFLVESVRATPTHLFILVRYHFVLESPILLRAHIINDEALVGGRVIIHTVVFLCRLFEWIEVLGHRSHQDSHLRPHVGLILKSVLVGTNCFRYFRLIFKQLLRRYLDIHARNFHRLLNELVVGDILVVRLQLIFHANARHDCGRFQDHRDG